MNKYSRPENPETLAQRYKDQAKIQQAVIRKLTDLRDTLERLEGAFSILFADEHFTTLLRAEGLDGAPKTLVARAMATEPLPSRSSPLDAASSAEEMLRSKKLSPAARYELGRMTPERQAEAARLMVASGCFLSPYLKAIVGACEKSQLLNPKARSRTLRIPTQSRVAINGEISEMANRIKELEWLKNTDAITAFIHVRYAKRLLANRRIRAYLTNDHVSSKALSNHLHSLPEHVNPQYRKARADLLAGALAKRGCALLPPGCLQSGLDVRRYPANAQPAINRRSHAL
jgi:hypothetical protein